MNAEIHFIRFGISAIANTEYAAKATNIGRADPGPVGAIKSVPTVSVTKAPQISNMSGIHFFCVMVFILSPYPQTEE